jgi:hypothetical protein
MNRRNRRKSARHKNDFAVADCVVTARLGCERTPYGSIELPPGEGKRSGTRPRHRRLRFSAERGHYAHAREVPHGEN